MKLIYLKKFGVGFRLNCLDRNDKLIAKKDKYLNPY